MMQKKTVEKPQSSATESFNQLHSNLLNLQSNTSSNFSAV